MALRSVWYERCSPERFARITDSVLTAAERGNVEAQRLVLQWSLGSPKSIDLLERLTAIETALGIEEPVE